MQERNILAGTTADNIRRKNKIGVIISAAVLGLFFIAVITMYVLSL